MVVRQVKGDRSMARRPQWWHRLQASKGEVRLAVDLYNRSGYERQLEAFIIHMTLGWLKLLQAHIEQQGGELYERDNRGWRKKHPDPDYRAISGMTRGPHRRHSRDRRSEFFAFSHSGGPLIHRYGELGASLA